MFQRPKVPERYLGESTPHKREQLSGRPDGVCACPARGGWGHHHEASEAGSGRGREGAVGLARCHVMHMLRRNKRVYMEPEMARRSPQDDKRGTGCVGS